MKSEKQLVELSLKDDKHFAELVERYEAKLSRYIFHLSSLDSASTEDILQEVFIKVYENLNGYDTSFSFSSWIYRITHNEVISFFRKKKARPQAISPDDVDEDYITLIPDDTDIPKELKRKELAAKVKKAVLELPEKYRDVLVLRYLEDKSYQEISDILKISINNASVLVNRAKEKLKSKLTI
ncbi:RNA polymerase sigma factor [Candidatus Peregrinibacteria bacterium]|jgi:RNA polymerase sigma-70 factor, ECF subfamily|nr:RNA polymerase sigma factor [Candidatus Peregrinibacteria bacterium]MBT7737051.1 RNA polymerase sigma factor [Candidatus Peregrinibacteria bacterium]